MLEMNRGNENNSSLLSISGIPKYDIGVTLLAISQLSWFQIPVCLIEILQILTANNRM